MSSIAKLNEIGKIINKQGTEIGAFIFCLDFFTRM